jgi:hypothetical protein
VKILEKRKNGNMFSYNISFQISSYKNMLSDNIMFVRYYQITRLSNSLMLSDGVDDMLSDN